MIKKVGVIGLLLCLSGSLVAEAADNTHWYILGGIAQVSGNSSSQELTQDLVQVGVTVNQLTIEDNRTGWQFKLGRSLTEHLALEAGFIDLGEVAISMTAEVSNPDGLIASANKIHPNSATGYTFGGVYRYCIYSPFYLEARAGLFIWHGDFESELPRGYQQINSHNSGIDAYLALGGLID
ncbi:hypothetical protein A3Q34_18370 [Colwellia sp. PAMC 20917]|uniref:hypothetical protein n=1 Tax=Colwellia sp. PAMC 20917 TaxID=1816218 RepID=UPI0008783F84|nr:hypothetical protein [Colwellia sp. PAMC 20917]AOW78629.1 hypothetical protein A3Q34_18370 [Colwellia sp. PAMC 20917]